MSINILLNISGLIIAFLAIVANLYSGYAQRKQMRQSELFRVNPGTGLQPPPHPVWVLFKENKTLIFSVGFETGLLIKTLLPSGPVTRLEVATIALTTSTITGLLIIKFVTVMAFMQLDALHDAQMRTRDFCLAVLRESKN